MDKTQIDWISDFIWNIADDVLRDVYVRGKYRDVILPFTVLRRLDAVLEPTKDAVLKMKQMLDDAGVSNQEPALRNAADQAFFNTSQFSLVRLKSSSKGQQLRDNFGDYLDGFSPNVLEILDKFKFRNQVQTLVDADILGTLIERFLDPTVNLSNASILDEDGKVKLPALDNHGMGTVFEELIRRFNEENNEEAGEHFTPRDVVKLMAKLLFLPVADKIESGTYLLYDGACGTGGMLTVAEEELKELAKAQGTEVSIHLYGQEINAETYAICKADLLLKGEGLEADNILGGGDKSTLSNDQFPSREFDFMLSNPPYGKSWKTDLERMGGKKEINDPRFVVQHGGDPEFKLITRSSDGQLMFLVNKLSKMKHNTPLGSRIALVHNGSALFTGDAGQGESNIRRWLIENDWLEAIIALPLNMFYNTGIATYIWVLTNRKSPERKGKVQLMDATQWFEPLRRNMGKKNCKLSDADTERIMSAFLNLTESAESRMFPNEAFGYWKITVERPLRWKSQFTRHSVEGLRFASGDEALRREIYGRWGQDIYTKFSRIRSDIEAFLKGENEEVADDDDESGETSPGKKSVPEKRRKKLLEMDTWLRDKRLVETARALWKELGDGLFDDHNVFREQFEVALKESEFKLSPTEKKTIYRAVSWRDETAPPVIARTYKPKAKHDEERAILYGHYLHGKGKQRSVVEYEPDTDLRDTEQVPLLEEGGIEAFFKREVLPHATDAWIDADSTKIGYEISFARYFYRPKPLRTLDEIRADILALESQTEGLLHNIVGGGA